MTIFQVLICAVICYIISGLIHELGHIVMGLMNGWKFYMLVIGPFEWKREKPNEKVRFFLEKNIMMWGGMGGSYPINTSKDNLKIWSKVLIAGPIASIIIGITMIPIAIITGNLFFSMLVFMPISMGIVSGFPLPLKTGFLYTDGGRWIRLKRGNQEAAEEKALFLITENSMINGENSLPDEEVIVPLLNSINPSIQYYGLYYHYMLSKSNDNQTDMNYALTKMNELKTKVSKLIIDDCKIK
ncbi:hypothetical protein AN1V17_18690 [Vallitalea sediminicola]